MYCNVKSEEQPTNPAGDVLPVDNSWSPSNEGFCHWKTDQAASMPPWDPYSQRMPQFHSTYTTLCTAPLRQTLWPCAAALCLAKQT